MIIYHNQDQGIIEYYEIGIPIPTSSPLHPDNPNFKGFPPIVCTGHVASLSSPPPQLSFYRKIPFPKLKQSGIKN